jgi:hypothetical protein
MVMDQPKFFVAMIGFALLTTLVTGCAGTVEPKQEPTIVTSWRTEGLIESAEFVSTSVSVSGSQHFKVLELRAVVLDMLVVVLIEETGAGCISTRRWEYCGYPVVGKEHLMDQAWEAWSSLPKNF